MKKNQKKISVKIRRRRSRREEEMKYFIWSEHNVEQNTEENREILSFKTKLNQIKISSLALNMNAGSNLGPDNQS